MNMMLKNKECQVRFEEYADNNNVAIMVVKPKQGTGIIGDFQKTGSNKRLRTCFTSARSGPGCSQRNWTCSWERHVA